MTLFDQRVNSKIVFSFCSIYVTNIFRPKDLATICLLVQEIQGPEICELSNLAYIPGTSTLGAQYLKTATSCTSIKQVLEGFMGFQNTRVICSPPNWYQFTQSLPPTDAKYQNAPYQRSNGHFQMTLFDQRVNITIIFSFYSIYVTY